MKKIKIIFSSLIMTMLLGIFIIPNISKVEAATNDVRIQYFTFENNEVADYVDETISGNEDIYFYSDSFNYPNINFKLETSSSLLHSSAVASFNDSDGTERGIRFVFKNPITILNLGTNYQNKSFDGVSSLVYMNSNTFTINGEEIFEISGYTGESVAGTFIMKELDNKRPVISGQENFVTNVNDERPLSYFQNFLSAYDETDGDVTDRLYVVKDNYSDNKRVLGTHEVEFGVDDLSGNEALVTVYIRVVDIDAPIITGSTSTEEISYTKTFDLNGFKSTLSVSDNVDTLKHTDITIKSDNYTKNKAKLGTYTVVYAVKDNSGNEGTFEKKIKVIDDIKPTFSGPTVISTSNNTILTESDVREQLTANDAIDGNITSKIKLVNDNYTGKGNKVGSYTIEYSVTDNAGNTATHLVTIERLDKIPPVIWIEDGVSIKTTPTTPLTFEQIIDILQATGQINVTANTTFTKTEDTYSGNEDQPGIYMMVIEAKSTNGNESKHSLTITVLADDNDDGVNVVPDFDIKEFVKDNWVFITIGSVVVLSLGYAYIRKRD